MEKKLLKERECLSGNSAIFTLSLVSEVEKHEYWFHVLKN